VSQVDFAALGSTRKMLGFSRKAVSIENATVADVLRSLETLEGPSLYENLTCAGKLRGDFAVVVDGQSLKSDQLEMKLVGGEQIVTMAILRHLHGG
jgi:aerobic-type carbon monoxide dehydrogenase small subunit (CoxS/CutS family)